MEDRVSQARLYLTWTGPRWGTRDAHLLDLASAILAGDKNSRLYQRLVYRDQIASDVAFAPLALEISGITYVQCRRTRAWSWRFLKRPSTKSWSVSARRPDGRGVERVKVRHRVLPARIEKVGGFVGKAGTLAESTVYGGSPTPGRRR